MQSDDHDMELGTPPPGRSVDITLASQEVITIDLENLDTDPSDLLDVIRESTSDIWAWTKIAAEYWRREHIDTAEKIARATITAFEQNGVSSALPPMYSLLANITLAKARKAPKVIMTDAQFDDMNNEKPKEALHAEAAALQNIGNRKASEAGVPFDDTLSFLTRGIQQLATREMEEALRTFDGILSTKPTNLVALLGKARILYARRQYSPALKLFQQVLQLNPNCLPDPRIGIGLCLWAMDHKAKAKAAWQRSMEVNPNEWAAQLLLGLESMNTSKDETKSQEERTQAYVTGTRLIERTFKANQRSAAAANGLCDLLLRKGDHNRAMKLAERTIQFADTLTLLTEGYIRAARVSHVAGKKEAAMKHYMKAVDGQPKNVLGAIGLAQMQMLNDEMAAAVHTLDTLLQPPNPSRSVEATVMLASLRAYQRPGVSSSDFTKEKVKARELFDRAAKELHLYEDVAQTNGHGPRADRSTPAQNNIKNDMDMHAEVARLWQDENLDRTAKALREALRISEATGKTDPRLLNNLGALAHLDENLADARAMYERALTSASGLASEVGEGMSTSVLYNLARVYEDEGDEKLATEAYEKLSARHPEYVDAKIRQAQILANLNRGNDAHELLKQGLSSQNGNLNLRAFYTHFLIQSNMPKPAKDFVFATLKDHDKHDIYSLCAAGWIQYYQARESRDTSSKGMEERRRGFQRSAEFYEKALHLDPLCAFAAQGLAIVTAEDALGTLSGSVPSSGSDESQRRFKNARDALDVFAKVRESVNDGSVYVNMGHCYYLRDEFDRAIESYETASKRFYNGHNFSVLMCLCRSWYAKANKEQSFPAMNTALSYAQKALLLQPSDKATLYNIAMIQQKAAEMMFSLPPAKRSLKDLQRSIDHAAHAQKLFASLASDPSELVPYSKDIADQRRKYGDSLLRRGDEHVTSQKTYEHDVQAKLDAARQKRQEERQRQDALEREKEEELRRQAELLAEERRKAREQALEWSREVKMESDEEREAKELKKARKAARKAHRDGGGSGDEASGEGKKKKRGRVKKEKDADGAERGDEEEALFSEDDGEKAVKKRVPKKRVVRDDDDEEGENGPGPRKKQVKSKEFIEDSDEEMS